MIKRLVLPLTGFLLGSTFIASFHIGILTTDTGISVDATLWDAPRAGHHVEGTLIFPATKDGKPILEGATKIKLTIINVDVPSRIFEWDSK